MKNGSMSVIKFSHKYLKLRDEATGMPVMNATLLGVYPIKLEEQHPYFLEYDTDNGVYPLPKKGKYLMLLFAKPSWGNLFTTLRKATPDKEAYYRALVGYSFKVEIKE